MTPRLGALITAGPAGPGQGGGLEGFVPLMPLRGSTVLGFMARTLRRAGIDHMAVLALDRSPEVHAEAARLSMACVSGAGVPGGAEGPRVAAALNALPGDLDGALVVDASFPVLRPATLRILAEGLGGRPVVRPCFLGEPGRPVLVAASCLPLFASWSASTGLEAALAALGAFHGVESVPVADSGVVFRVSGPEDLREAMRRVSRLERPSPVEAQALLDMAGMDPRAREHAAMVARVALALARALSRARGWPMDMPYVQASAMLLDVGFRRKDKAALGARLLDGAGFHEAARLVEDCRGRALDPHGPLGEAQVVALADRMVQAGVPVGIARRMGDKLARFGRDEPSRRLITHRYAQAMSLLERFEREAGAGAREILASEGLYLPGDPGSH